MVAFADTGFLASLYLLEATSVAARTAVRVESAWAVPFTLITELELRNAFNRAVHRQRISLAMRDALWRDVEADLASGFLVPTPMPLAAWHEKARTLSDLYTPTTGARSLDLLHVAAALTLKAKLFLTFDERQAKVASLEGLRVKP